MLCLLVTAAHAQDGKEIVASVDLLLLANPSRAHHSQCAILWWVFCCCASDLASPRCMRRCLLRCVTPIGTDNLFLSCLLCVCVCLLYRLLQCAEAAHGRVPVLPRAHARDASAQGDFAPRHYCPHSARLSRPVFFLRRQSLPQPDSHKCFHALCAYVCLCVHARVCTCVVQ